MKTLPGEYNEGGNPLLEIVLIGAMVTFLIYLGLIIK